MSAVPDAAVTAAFDSWSESMDCAGLWPPSPRSAFHAGWVAAAAQAATAEREECAQLAEAEAASMEASNEFDYLPIAAGTLRDFADLIRARGTT